MTALKFAVFYGNRRLSFSNLNPSENIVPIMASSNGCPKEPLFHQNVVVLRHGDRIDYIDPTWAASAARPWDPPLIEAGKARAFRRGCRIRNQIDFPVHRVFVSPFLRCLQTAYGVVTALSAVDNNAGNSADETFNGVVIDPSKIKVSIEFGLCEVLNSSAIKSYVAPKDGIFSFDISKCEAELPPGTIDNSVEPVYKELPIWEETAAGARARYHDVIEALADKYPSENLLLVTHGEGVASAVYKYVKNVDMISDVEYCAYTHLSRPVFLGENKRFTAGDLVGSPEGQVGLKYTSLNDELEGSVQKSK